MTRVLLALTVALALNTGASAGGSLAEVDSLYLQRDKPGKLERSIELLKAEPKDPAAQWRLGRSLIAQANGKTGKDQKLAVLGQAGQTLRSAVSVSPNDANAHYWLAQQLGAENAIKRKLKLAKEMKKELEEALRLDPSNAAALTTYGALLRQLPGFAGGDKKKAVTKLESAVNLGPDDPGRWVALAQAYLDVDDKDQARAALKKALAVEKPDDPPSAPQDRRDAQKLLDSLK